MLGADARQTGNGAAAEGTALRVTVINGDLTFIRQPLLLGHYRSTRLTGTERVMNRLIGGAMEVSLEKGLYPDPPGTDQTFVNTRTHPDNPFQLPRPEANERLDALDTRRARTEVRAQSTQGDLPRGLIADASNDQNSDPQIGRTLFQLLVPVEIEPFLAGTTEMQIELDGGTAGIPWELLDTNSRGRQESQPWTIRAKLLRKLRTETFRANVVDADAESSVLVIGEPACDPKIYPSLPGARAEARAVAERFSQPGALGVDRVAALIRPDDESDGPDARRVTNALMHVNGWRIVHIAGHGEPPEKLGSIPVKPGDPPQRDGKPRGVVLSKGFLGPAEIQGMRTVPELVFVNCCHLAARNTAQLFVPDDSLCGKPYNRAQFASTVAEQLIKIGVRCVIAAGWAVEDRAAMTFATKFYDAILRSTRFIDAVSQAPGSRRPSVPMTARRP